MRIVSLAVALLALTCLSRAPAASAAITYTTIDHPLAGLGGTTPYAIDGTRVVGSYLDPTGGMHGFVYDGGNWTTLDHPAAARGTTAYGISGNLICGTYVTPSAQTLGFLYDGTNWLTLQHPPIALPNGNTFARGVSDGTVVGYYIEGPVATGFRYAGGSFTDFAAPGSVGTFATDIDGGRIVGYYDTPAATHGFLFDATWVTVDHPLGEPLGTFVNGISGQNVVGNYVSVLDGSHGFLFDGTRFTAIDYPGGRETSANGIDGQRVVGSYVNATGTHGFIAIIPEPACLLFLPCLFAALVRPTRVARV